jgi:hypothetical protein
LALGAEPPAATAARRTTFIVLALLIAVLLLAGRAANAAVAISVTVAPPPLPVYEQPVILGPGYFWVPGYWSYGDAGYFWVPGTWVLPPDPDLLWTPGYWIFADGAYVWNAGYWAPVVGFYGGINYGYGYSGRGYEGGYWRDHQFYYNRSVNNIGAVNVTNVYEKTVVNNVSENTVSYAGGPGGVNARPTPQEQATARQARHAPTSEQMQHISVASKQHELLASVNRGRPEIAATARPGAFSGAGITRARGASAPASSAATQPRRLAEAAQTPQRPAQPAHPPQTAPAEPQERPAPERPAPSQPQRIPQHAPVEPPRGEPPHGGERGN